MIYLLKYLHYFTELFELVQLFTFFDKKLAQAMATLCYSLVLSGFYPIYLECDQQEH
jgi:hypothetical protein